ncbi:hypothetical protein [Legionella worsleiensis]|uniref:Uncharacterized protein n=1 Tax=Legionella worsleiensis TaxID=45076 RepID=A0A0W1A641_9GAMM|nr:hypothetical protein [Legionella worsleiensis]KTD76834.1 hypothetical protein Lwor_2059 [Legionella worsleiensis]STY30710.1 Uncharacterised protein [Legionella worsleiensis]
MHANLAKALNYLDITAVALRDSDGNTQSIIKPKAHAAALFHYLEIAGYLTPELFGKAISYLAAAKPFSCSNSELVSQLHQACLRARADGGFSTDVFFEYFCNDPLFKVEDIIDLIVFLQQTAFDRSFGVERDRLQTKTWMEQHKERFGDLATQMGVITPQPPMKSSYCGTAIMGASSPRVESRIEYFNQLAVDSGLVWALSGNRELSKGLDSEELMEKVAEATGRKAVYVEKGSGAARREFLDGVTETMMVNYLLEKMCQGKAIAVVDSAVQEGHWRATTDQSARDIVEIMIQKIKNAELLPDTQGVYRFMIIAEQPHSGRMARQVQRAFNTELQRQGLSSTISFIVEGVGPGIQPSKLNDLAVLSQVSSELGALMAERYRDARLSLMENNPGISLRNPDILMFSTRDKAFAALQEEASHHHAASSSSSYSPGN